MSLLSITLTLLISLLSVDADFNFEVEKRVLERIHDFMNGPVTTTTLTDSYRHGGGFPYNMDARDRDRYLTYAYTYMKLYSFYMVYYGLEDGLFVGYGNNWGTYREPGYSYNLSDMEIEDKKYFNACVNSETGLEEDCSISAGSKYIQCVDNCRIEVCPDEESQMCYNQQNNVSTAIDGGSTPVQCQQNSIKWCHQYDIMEASTGANINSEQQQLGFIPRSDYCHDELGRLTQQVGRVLQSDGSLGNCYYGDGTTLVNRSTVADYEYCTNGKKCNAYFGAYMSREYDHRYRNWYKITKEVQEPNWSPPYIFFSKLDLGITYSHPVYVYNDDDTRIFDGVLAVDYTFAEISNFLRTSYLNTSTSVVVYEKAKPNYIVASSTGRKAAKFVLTNDTTTPCPANMSSFDICTVVREEMSTLDGYPMDTLLRRAYESQEEAKYPRELIIVKESNFIGSQVYIAQSSEYKAGNLEWIVLVISPANDNSESYQLTSGNPLFGLVCAISTTGIILCGLMFVLNYRQRTKYAVVIHDWRFTCAFILGCSLMNLSPLTMLGPNTDALCLTRMWTFHLLFVTTLSPLFIKIWRLNVIAKSSRKGQRITVSNVKASLYTLPFIFIQVVILTVFTILDPPKQRESIIISEGVVAHQIVCAQESIAFNVTEFAFEATLIIIGCALAYITRDLKKDFSEARELIFSMCNIAFIGVSMIIVLFIMDGDTAGKIVSISLGIFWGTVFSSAAFVIPQILRAKEEDKKRVGGAPFSGRASIQITGLDPNFLKTLDTFRPSPNGNVSVTSFRLKKLDNNELSIVQDSKNTLPKGNNEDAC